MAQQKEKLVRVVFVQPVWCGIRHEPGTEVELPECIAGRLEAKGAATRARKAGPEPADAGTGKRAGTSERAGQTAKSQGDSGADSSGGEG